MKRINVLTGFSCLLALSVPVFLTGCDSMSSPFGHSDASYTYAKPDYRKANATVTTTENPTSHKVAKGAPVDDSGVSTTKTPTVTSASTTTVTSDAPMVPGAAPVLGQ